MAQREKIAMLIFQLRCKIYEIRRVAKTVHLYNFSHLDDDVDENGNEIVCGRNAAFGSHR